MMRRIKKRMRKREKENAAVAPAPASGKTYYYKVCPHCGAWSHIDNVYCAKCGKEMEGAGGIATLHSTIIDPGVKRMNLDHPKGCPACGGGCGYCWSFSVKEPSVKAPCGHCEKTRAACCINARKLPSLSEMLPGATLEALITGRLGEYMENRGLSEEIYSERVERCHAHVRLAPVQAELTEAAV
jgi:hypothetical protein